jgi:phosphoglycerate dehydrogenase-like enzyme
MTAALHLLLARAPEQQPVFWVTPEQVAEARARATVALPPIEATVCPIDDPSFATMMDKSFGMVGFRFPREVVGSSKGALSLLQLTSAGVEHLLPFDWLPPHVALANASGVHAPKVEEWATMVFLMLHTHMPHFASAQRRHQWSKVFSSTIEGRHAAIFGTGAIGAAIARGGKRLGLKITGISRSAQPVEGFDSVITPADAGPTLAQADFVVLATPLTPQTRGMMDAAMFARLRKGAGFANFGRGGLVVQEALIEALTSGHLDGAVLDVTTPEPLPADSPLWDAPNLLISPHVSCDDPVTYIPRTLDIFMDNIHRRLNGLPLRNLVDPTRSY